MAEPVFECGSCLIQSQCSNLAWVSSAILGVAPVGTQKYGGLKGWEALGISFHWPGASLPIPSDLSSPQLPCTVLWIPGRARPLCPLIFLKLRGTLVTSQLSLCKQFANSRLGKLDSEQGPPSQTRSPQESIAHAPWTPVAGFALEYAP